MCLLNEYVFWRVRIRSFSLGRLWLRCLSSLGSKSVRVLGAANQGHDLTPAHGSFRGEAYLILSEEGIACALQLDLCVDGSRLLASHWPPISGRCLGRKRDKTAAKSASTFLVIAIGNSSRYLGCQLSSCFVWCHFAFVVQLLKGEGQKWRLHHRVEVRRQPMGVSFCQVDRRERSH